MDKIDVSGAPDITQEARLDTTYVVRLSPEESAEMREAFTAYENVLKEAREQADRAERLHKEMWAVLMATHPEVAQFHQKGGAAILNPGQTGPVYIASRSFMKKVTSQLDAGVHNLVEAFQNAAEELKRES